MTPTTPMTPVDLARLLDAFGTEPRHWPGESRLAAELLIETDPAARALLHQAEARDRRVSALLTVPASERQTSSALIGRVIAHVAARRQEWVFHPGRRLAAAACALVVIGFVAGGLVASYEASLNQESALLALELTYDDGGVL